MEEFVNNFVRIASGITKMVHFDDLEKNTAYPINQFRFIDTRNGKCVAIDFENGTWVILPHRLGSLITTDEHIEALTNKRFNLIYLGRDESRMNMALLDFRTIPAATFNVTGIVDPQQVLTEVLFGEVLDEIEAQKPKSKKMKR